MNLALSWLARLLRDWSRIGNLAEGCVGCGRLDDKTIGKTESANRALETESFSVNLHTPSEGSSREK